MSLETKVMDAIKLAMKAKDKERLESLRAIKAGLLLAKTEGANSEITEDIEMKLLLKLVKQRRDSAELYTQQKREELAQVEMFQADVIAEFLPKQLSEEEVAEIISGLIKEVGATGPQDMGKVMGMASKKLAGKAEGKFIAQKVKELLAAI